MIERVHPVCEPGCTHRQVPDRGGVIVTAAQDKGRAESERFLAEKFPGKRIEFLGMSDAEDWHTQAWRIGARPWRPMPSAERTEGKQAKREVKYLHRPAFWEGDGPPGPVDFSRPAEPEPEPYPAPSLTSVMNHVITASQPASGLQALARANGWDAVITFARGHVPHATHGRPSAAEKFSEALRLTRGDQRAVAVRMGGSWESLWTWSASQFFTRHATLADFKEVIAQPVQTLVHPDGAIDG